MLNQLDSTNIDARESREDDHSANHLACTRMSDFYNKYKPFLNNISAIDPFSESPKYIDYLSEIHIPRRKYDVVPIGTFSIEIIEKYKENIIAFSYGMVGCKIVFADPKTKQHIQVNIGCPPRAINNHKLLVNVGVLSYDTQELFQFIEDNSDLLIPFSILDNKRVGI